MRLRQLTDQIFVLCLVVGCFHSVCLAQKTPPTSTPQALFDFHSGFWINLHHFLYLEALSEQSSAGPHPSVLSEPDAAALKSLSPEERFAWNSAVSYYASSVIQRDVLFDRGMGAIKNQLEDAETSPDLANVDIPAALREILVKAAPIYRKHWWERHDAQNRQWIAQVQPLVAEHGTRLRDSMVKIYEAPWPGEPVRVDVTVWASKFGAYTTNEPTRPTISSADPSNQGAAALEIVFHETSHGMIRPVHDAIQSASENVPGWNAVPHAATLWHGVLFYTAGELIAEQVPGYVPYADKNGLWDRGWPGPVQALIVQDWKPHIDGTVPLSTAITKLVKDLAVTTSHH